MSQQSFTIPVLCGTTSHAKMQGIVKPECVDEALWRLTAKLTSFIQHVDFFVVLAFFMLSRYSSGVMSILANLLLPVETGTGLLLEVDTCSFCSCGPTLKVLWDVLVAGTDREELALLCFFGGGWATVFSKLIMDAESRSFAG